jgi:hypothetical protein
MRLPKGSIFVIFDMPMPKTATKQKKIAKVRKDLAALLDRNGLTLPEVLGISRLRRDPDEETWESIKDDYEEAQTEMFKERYPKLWQKVKKG